jgi:DNA-binding NtrC family response regulator
MNQLMQSDIAGPGFEEFSTMPDFIRIYARTLLQPQNRGPLVTDPEAVRSLEKIKESLVFAYLVTNLNSKNLPLKAFIDSFEKKILLTCLRLTGGNQKKAAAIMSIKPTLLFEKMRKHGISRQQLQLPGAWDTLLPNRGE